MCDSYLAVRATQFLVPFRRWIFQLLVAFDLFVHLFFPLRVLIASNSKINGYESLVRILAWLFYVWHCQKIQWQWHKHERNKYFAFASASAAIAITNTRRALSTFTLFTICCTFFSSLYFYVISIYFISFYFAGVCINSFSAFWSFWNHVKFGLRVSFIYDSKSIWVTSLNGINELKPWTQYQQQSTTQIEWGESII